MKFLFFLMALPVVSLISFVLGPMSYGYALSLAWAWHVVPFGFGAIGWKTFALMSAAWWLFHPQLRWQKDDRTADEKLAFAVSILFAPWIFLFFAWVLL